MHEINVFGVKKDVIEYTKRIGGYAVIYKEETGEIAVVKNEKAHCFLPGGGLKLGESLEECIIRECREEVGLKVAVKKFIGSAKQYFQSPNDDIYYLNEGHFYTCNTEEEQVPLEKNNTLLWIEPSIAIKMLVHEHHRWAIVNFLQRSLL